MPSNTASLRSVVLPILCAFLLATMHGCSCSAVPDEVEGRDKGPVHLTVGTWKNMPNDLHLGNPAKLSTREIGRLVEAKNNRTIAAALAKDPAAETSIAALDLVTMVEHGGK